jgi:hypothetical protein
VQTRDEGIWFLDHARKEKVYKSNSFLLRFIFERCAATANSRVTASMTMLRFPKVRESVRGGRIGWTAPQVGKTGAKMGTPAILKGMLPAAWSEPGTVRVLCSFSKWPVTCDHPTLKVRGTAQQSQLRMERLGKNGAKMGTIFVFTSCFLLKERRL